MDVLILGIIWGRVCRKPASNRLGEKAKKKAEVTPVTPEKPQSAEACPRPLCPTALGLSPGRAGFIFPG